MELPSVAVLLPVLNEEAAIDGCLESLATQDYTGLVEILVADGGSSDDTLERLGLWAERIPRLRVFDNPDREQSLGLNLLADVTTADILIRADAHTTYARDYIRRSVETLEKTGAAAAGGPMRPEGTTPFGRAVARAFQSKLGIGPARFHHTNHTTPADTVYLGAMRRHTWIDAGGMRSLPSGVAEDADLYYRVRQRGGTVLIDPRIISKYQPRDSPKRLWRQFYRYGLGKADMLMVNGEFPSWRPLAPLALVLVLATGCVLWVIGDIRLLVAGLAVWLVVLLVASRLHPLVLVATALMHLSYGLGLARGLLRRPAHVRRQVKGGP